MSRTSPGLGAGSHCPRHGGGQRGRRVLLGTRWVCVCAAATLAARERPGGALGARVLHLVAFRPGAHTRPRPPSLPLLPRSAHPQAERPPPPLSLCVSSSRSSREIATPGVGNRAALLARHREEKPGSASRRQSCALRRRQRPRCPGRGQGADVRAPPTPLRDPPWAPAAAWVRAPHPPGSLHGLHTAALGKGPQPRGHLVHAAGEALGSPPRRSRSFTDFLAFPFKLLCCPAA